MAKKRERRVTPSLNQRKDKVEPSTQLDQPDDSASSDRRLIIIFIVFFIVSPAISMLVYRIKFAPSTSTDFVDSYIHQLGLVNPDVNYRQILSENSKVSENSSGKHYSYPVLAYITPWNSKGYEIAKKFNSKFTHLSPVWYDLKSQESNLVLEGRHNADMGWISDLRMSGEALLLSKKMQWTKVIDLIVSECKVMGYDGIVLESWSRWAAYGILHDPNLRNLALQFIKQMGQALHSVSSKRNDKQPLQLVYVIGPPHSEKLQFYDFRPEDLQSVGDAVDGFSLMTYDFSGPHNPGPNAPLTWIRSTLQLLRGTTTSKGVWTMAHKIFLGINFYGNDFVLSDDGGGGAITERDYLLLLEKHKPVLQWEKNSAEHLFFYIDDNHNKHVVFYPSLMSISMRLEEARKWGCGISIWEIGQGLDYFYELL